MVGTPLGFDATEAAAAIIAVASNHLASAIRLVSIEKGYDPRDFALFPFGGAGPLHAVALARELGVPTVLVPRFPGLTSALGCILGDLRHDFVRTIGLPLFDADPAAMDAAFAEQRAQGEKLIAEENVPVERDCRCPRSRSSLPRPEPCHSRARDRPVRGGWRAAEPGGPLQGALRHRAHGDDGSPVQSAHDSDRPAGAHRS